MAFGSINSGDDAPMADINVTPLVDVMLVLLIVFMITMPVLTHSIPLELPTGTETSPPPTQPKEPIRLTIDQEGKYFLGLDASNPQDLSELKQNLATSLEKDPNIIIAIAADKDVSYDYVAKALDTVREAKISKVGFVTQVPSK